MQRIPNVIQVREDQSQILRYNNPAFDCYAHLTSRPSTDPFYVMDHWHEDLEFTYVTKGALDYTVNGERLTINAGEGIIVNSHRLHANYISPDIGCDFYVVIIHPMLLCTSRYLEQTFVEPLISNRSFSYIKLDPTIDWHNRILLSIGTIYHAMGTKTAELTVMEHFYKIWTAMFENVQLQPRTQIPVNNYLVTMKNMLTFIQTHYMDKVTLEEIAAAGNTGKTLCTRLFKKYVNRTPIEYLMDYRIQESTKLLAETSMSITEICYNTGFASASYFSKAFKEIMGCSPNAYRKKNQSQEVEV